MVATLAHLVRLGWRLTLRVTLGRGHRVFVPLCGWGRCLIYPIRLVHVLLLMVATLAHLSRLGWRLTLLVTLCRRLRVSALLHRRHGTLGLAALSIHAGLMPKYVSLSAALDARSTS